MDMSVKIVQIALKKENRKEMTAEFAELVRSSYTAELLKKEMTAICVLILAEVY